MDFSKKIEENDLEYICRICSMKDMIGTWTDVANIINTNLGTNHDESCFRKKFNTHVNIVQKEICDEKSKTSIDALDAGDDYTRLVQEREELYKQKIKTRDYLNTCRNNLRNEARAEAIIEAIKEDNVRYNPTFRPYTGATNGYNSAILCLGDWHCGDNVHNFYNDFNLDILEQRVADLCDRTIRYCLRNNVKTLNVVNLGDLIQGQIHITSRIQNEIDAVQQVKIVVRLLSEFLVKLSQNIEQVIYRSVLDNHSRINNNYKEHIQRESFANLIDWWLTDKIEWYNSKYADEIKNQILMPNDNIDENIGYFKINNKNIFFSHGHLGSQNTVTQDLTFATGIVADVVILGHWHTDKIKNYQGKKVYFNGSLKGVDSFALDRRLFNPPSQSLLIFEDKDIIDIPIQL